VFRRWLSEGWRGLIGWSAGLAAVVFLYHGLFEVGFFHGEVADRSGGDGPDHGVDVAACGRGDTDQVACRGDVHVLDTGCRGQSVGDGLGRDTGDGRADAAHARDPQR
jgi:hypothetical protein